MEMKLCIKFPSLDGSKIGEGCEDREDPRNGQPSTDCKSETYEKLG